MGLLDRFYSKLNIVICNFSSTDNYSISFAISRITKNGVEIEHITDIENKKEPALLLFCGYGVVIKPFVDGDMTLNKVMGEKDNFVWNYSPDKTNICFARHSQIEKLTGVFEDFNIFKTKCCSVANSVDDVFLTETILSAYNNDIKFRKIIKPTEQSSVLAIHLAKRIRMPLLALMFALLLANLFISQNIGNKYANSRLELTQLESTRTEKQDSDNASRDMLLEFNNNILDVRYAIISDRIASLVPANIVLTQLSIQPKLKALEQDKLPILSLQTINIQGTANSAEDISSFVTAMRELDFITNVELTRLGASRNTTSPQFQITAKL